MVNVLEAEVLWGKGIKQKVCDVLYKVRELEIAVEDYIQLQEVKGFEKGDPDWKKRSLETHRIVHSMTGIGITPHEDDKYAIGLQEKIELVEYQLKPFLQR